MRTSRACVGMTKVTKVILMMALALIRVVVLPLVLELHLAQNRLIPE